MKIRTAIISFFILMAIALSVVNAYAISGSSSSETATVGERVRELRQDIKNRRGELREDIKELKEEQRSFTRELRETIRSLVPLFRKHARIINGEVSAIDGTSLTVEKDGKSYTVNTDSKTKFRRRFWGKSSLPEISVGDKVNVWGRWTDDARTTILARMMRNLSIQKRRGVFFGEVLSLGANSFVMASINRGNPTVTIDSETQIIARNQSSIVFSDIKIGHRVRVKGLWDKTANAITDVTQIKDFSLPPVATSTPTPTP